MRLDRAFRNRLTRFDFKSLHDSYDVVYGTWADGRLAYTNDGWDRFAAENEAPRLNRAWPLGRSIWEVVPEALLTFYRDGWEWALTSGSPWGHTYECSSEDVTRIYRMTVMGLPDAGAVLVMNALVASLESSAAPRGPLVALGAAGEEAYRDASGLLTQCAHCRRVQYPPQPVRWDWVPAWVHRSPSETTHGLCGVCFAYHYRDVQPARSDGRKA
ncbi:MAG: hypothetical protein Q7K37_01175 [Dehalococcoidia bacterium]|nr:hypothetical protein [Dehalococcoidia bacterium]